jgi:signal peptidase II
MGIKILNNPTLFRRRKYLIVPRFQFKYLAIIVLLIFIILLVTTQVVNITIRTTPILENLSEMEVLTVSHLIFKTILTICCIFIFIVIILGVFVSHRIAGPLYVFDKMFNLVSQGDLTIKLKLRKGDELQKLAENFQKMVDNLYLFIKTDKEKIDEIKKEVRSLTNEFVLQSNQELQQRLNKISLMLDELYKNFKL